MKEIILAQNKYYLQKAFIFDVTIIIRDYAYNDSNEWFNESSFLLTKDAFRKIQEAI